jgi:hypothetical protein
VVVVFAVPVVVLFLVSAFSVFGAFVSFDVPVFVVPAEVVFVVFACSCDVDSCDVDWCVELP